MAICVRENTALIIIDMQTISAASAAFDKMGYDLSLTPPDRADQSGCWRRCARRVFTIIHTAKAIVLI